MRNPFRRKSESDKRFDDLKAQLREFEAKKQNERESMKEVCFEIGRTLLACAMVEQQLNDALKFLKPRVNVANWIDTGEDRKMLAQAIKEFRRRFAIAETFFSDLEHFRVCRNKFIHHIWEASRIRLNSAEGRSETTAFVRDVYKQARQLNAIFAPVIMHHHGRVLGWSEETIESFLPPELRKPPIPPP